MQQKDYIKIYYIRCLLVGNAKKHRLRTPSNNSQIRIDIAI